MTDDLFVEPAAVGGAAKTLANKIYTSLPNGTKKPRYSRAAQYVRDRLVMVRIAPGPPAPTASEMKIDAGLKQLVDKVYGELPAGTTRPQFARASQIVCCQLAKYPKPS